MTRIGLDIGGTKTRGVALDQTGRILADITCPTGAGGDEVIATAVSVTRECLASADLPLSSLDGVGVGIPGRVDPRRGVVRTAVNLGITELDLGPGLSAEFGVRVVVDNDVKAAALGAANHVGRSDLTYFNFGTGVASATLVDGRLVRGAGNVAGELGHVPIHPDGPACGCGQRGCVEVFAGGRWVAERLASHDPALSLPTLVADAARDPGNAGAELRRISSAIAAAVQMAVLAYGSERVVLGGGVVHTAVGLEGAVRDALAHRASASAFLASLDLPDRVTIIPPQVPVAVVGAALVAGPLQQGRTP